MAMVMPRSFSSGALSISSNGVKSAMPFSARTLVMAAVRVVLPWSMCPIVPMFTWGLVRSNFFLLMPSAPLLAPDLRHDLLGDVRRDLLVGMELHRVRGPALGAGSEVGGVPEHLRQGDHRPDRLAAAPLLHPLDLPPPAGEVGDDVPHVLLRRHDLDLHHGLEQDGVGPL